MFCSDQERQNISERIHKYTNIACGLTGMGGGVQDEVLHEQTGANPTPSELLLLTYPHSNIQGG